MRRDAARREVDKRLAVEGVHDGRQVGALRVLVPVLGEQSEVKIGDGHRDQPVPLDPQRRRHQLGILVGWEGAAFGPAVRTTLAQAS